MASDGVKPDALARTARRIGGVRANLEAQTAGFLSAHGCLYPEGYARLDRAAFAAAEPEIARRALSALLITIGGGVYPPRHANLMTLCTDLRWQPGMDGPRFRARTLGGCRIACSGARFLICREAGRCEVLTAPPGAGILWDKRFFVRLPADRTRARGLYTVRSLGEAGWAAIRREIMPGTADFLPKSVRMALPAIHRSGQIVAVPHLKFNNVGSFRHEDVQFMPAKSATSARFSVV
jgi:tRNA(Ile)-lysidine synthase